VFNTIFVLETLANKRHTLFWIRFVTIGEKAVSILIGNYLLVVCFKGTGRSRVMNTQPPISVVVQSAAWVCGRPFAGITGFESLRGNGYISFVNIVYCQVEVSATGRFLAQRNPTVCACMCVSAFVIKCDEVQQ